MPEESELFPLFAALQPLVDGNRPAKQSSRRQSRGKGGGSRPTTRAAAEEPARSEKDLIVERLKRMETMQIKMIWLTPDEGPEPGGRRKGKRRAGRKGAAASTAVGNKETEMGRHFFRKGQPLVGLRYLQAAMLAHRDAMAANGQRGRGVQGAEYAMACNSANTACLLAQPPILKLEEAKELTLRAMETLASHDDTAVLAENFGRAGLRRLEHAACEHNLALLELVAQPRSETWQHLIRARSSAESAVRDAPELSGNVHAVAVHRSYTALKRVLSAAASSSQKQPKKKQPEHGKRQRQRQGRGRGQGTKSRAESAQRGGAVRSDRDLTVASRGQTAGASSMVSRPETSVSWGMTTSFIDTQSLEGVLDDSVASHNARVAAGHASGGGRAELTSAGGPAFGSVRVGGTRQRTAPMDATRSPPDGWGRAMTAPNDDDLVDAAAANANAAAAAVAALPPLDQHAEARREGAGGAFGDRPRSR